MSSSESYDDALATRPFKHRIDRRDRRALAEELIVLDHGPDVYRVYSETGKEYLVDTRLPSCTCPDFQYRDTDCKHIRRARIETGERSLDAVETEIQDALDELDAHITNLAAQRAELVGLRRDLDRLKQN
jgi:predicted nucleic acid-binding Zn finger protein